MRKLLGRLVPLTLAALVALVPLTAQAASVVLLTARTLPAPQPVPPVVAAEGGDAYLFLGRVYQFDSHANTFAGTGTALPGGQGGTSVAAWDPRLQRAFILGGNVCTPAGCGTSDQISSYDPRTNTSSLMQARLPQAVSFASAAYAGGFIYVFGGALPGCCPYTDQIVRYDPLADSVQVMNAHLPSGRINMSAAVFAGDVYLFGGCCTFDQGTGGYREIVRYDPAADAAQLMTASLPTGRYYTSAATLGSTIYVFGGTGGGFKDLALDAYYPDIVQYDPVADSLSLSSVQLPTGRSHTSAVAMDGKAYIFGGFYADATGEHNLSDILRFDPHGR